MPNSLIRFEAFLREAENRATKVYRFNPNGVLRVIAFLAAAVLLGRFAIDPHTPVRIVGILFLAGWISGGIFRRLESGRKVRLSRRDPLHLTYLKHIEELKKFMENRSLAERMHPAVARRLEGVADSFFRIKTWLKTPSSKNVLGSQLHADVVQATDRAMREVLFSIHGSYRPKGMEKKAWQKMVDSDPEAIEVCNSLAKVNGLLEQLTDIMKKVESFGATITLTDQLRAISDAIEEMEQTTYATIKSLPAPTTVVRDREELLELQD